MGAEQSLSEAAAEGDEVRVTELLADEGKARALVRERDAQGTTALHLAAEEGHSDIVAILLEAGAEPLIGDDIGFTPLHR
jgi:ankyrin repeat protein